MSSEIYIFEINRVNDLPRGFNIMRVGSEIVCGEIDHKSFLQKSRIVTF